jgi:hypothetical protein
MKVRKTRTVGIDREQCAIAPYPATASGAIQVVPDKINPAFGLAPSRFVREGLLVEVKT